MPAPTVQKISKSAAKMTPWKSEAFFSRSRSVYKPKQSLLNRRDFCKDPVQGDGHTRALLFIVMSGSCRYAAYRQPSEFSLSPVTPRN